MFDVSVHQVAIRVGACLIVMAVHGFALAAIAWALGDRGPKFDGRLTANPFGHIDVVGTPVMILAQAGWIKPIAIDPAELRWRQLRWGRVGLIVCVLGSLGITLVAVALLMQLRIPIQAFLPNAFVPTIIATLNETVEVTAWFVAFNMLPLPPLTGMHVLVALRPTLASLSTRYRLHAALTLGALALSLTFMGVLQVVLQPVRMAIRGLLPGLY